MRVCTERNMLSATKQDAGGLNLLHWPSHSHHTHTHTQIGLISLFLVWTPKRQFLLRISCLRSTFLVSFSHSLSMHNCTGNFSLGSMCLVYALRSNDNFMLPRKFKLHFRLCCAMHVKEKKNKLNRIYATVTPQN